MNIPSDQLPNYATLVLNALKRVTKVDYEYIEDYLQKVKLRIENSSRGMTRIRLKTILNNLGYSRRSKQFIDAFNYTVQKLGINTDQNLDLSIPQDALISFTLNGVEEDESNYPQKENSVQEVFHINEDFLNYLFDFGSSEEYERFQACLHNNKPMGIFLVPENTDFFSDILEKVLVYEIIRRRQYKLEVMENELDLNSSTLQFGTMVMADENLEDSTKGNSWSKSNIYHFNCNIMSDVILGTTGKEIIGSEKFNDQFNQLAFYSNKYLSRQFFILFHCPSKYQIDSEQREDIFGDLVDKVSEKLPYVFTLRCKYKDDQSIDKLTRKKIIDHFKLLLEVPNYLNGLEDMTLHEAFVELQKTQTAMESQILLSITPEYFNKLRWGYESDEHVYLKYFAIKNLEEKGYRLSDIYCEFEVSPNENKKGKRRPDVYIKDKVIVEVETLRGKATGDNVFLNLIKNILDKIDGWQEKLDEFWLVLPGFECSRNYCFVKKAQEIIERKLTDKYGSKVRFSVMAPDYEYHKLIQVNFDNIQYPALGVKGEKLFTNKRKTYETKKVVNQINFSSIIGLEEEKNRLLRIQKLNNMGVNSGIGGILFFGLPGCGKTLLAKAFANESERYFFQFSPADIQSVWIGQTQKNIKSIFSQAKAKSPSLLFIDELDSIAFNRNEQHAHTDQKATINQLLIELNNIKEHNVLVVAATNLISKIDSALKRSGRFDWKIPIFPPNEYERGNMFNYYLTILKRELLEKFKVEINLDFINFNELGVQSKRFNSSDIELLCNEIRQAILLEELGKDLTTNLVIYYIQRFNNQGLSLSKEDVEDFLSECSTQNIKSNKIRFLKEEWNINFPILEE